MGFTKRLFIALYVVAGLVAPTCAKAIAQSSPRTVLILDDSDPDSPFSRQIRGQVHSVLDAEVKQGYAIYTEFLNLGHFNESDYDATLHAYVKNKYRNKLVRIIVAIGTRALQFSLRLRADIWPRIPIVFVTFDDTGATGPVPSNTTGIIAQRQFQDLVSAARLLVPHLARIALVGDPIERQPYRQHYLPELRDVKDLKVIDLTGQPLEKVKKRVAALPDDAAIVYIPIFGDKSGMIHNPGEALRDVADVANRPIVVDSAVFIGKGATGGLVPAARDIGRKAGVRIARILKGEAASGIPVETKDFSKPEFDARQLERWNISEASLPADSDVRFREPSAWERYRWQILATAILIALQSLIIGWLLFERRRRHIAEREAHQHLVEVTKMDRAMTASAMSASFAHELNQPLSAILNNAEAAEFLLSGKSFDQNELKEILADIRRDNQRAVEIIKHLRMLLKREDLARHEIDLTKVVNDTLKLVGLQAKKHGVTLEVEPLPADIRVHADSVHIQQVVLNLALNAIDAMQYIPVDERILRLRITRTANEVMVSIADTGMGIPEDKLNSIFEPFVTTKEQGTGLGLSIAKTIIATYGGNIWAEKGARGGAIFHFTLATTHADAA